MRPADIGSWGLLQVVQEGGRLWRQHFRNFLPAIVTDILPASLITVVSAQCSPRFFVSPPSFDTQGSAEETAWTFQYVDPSVVTLVLALPKLFNLLGTNSMFDELTNVVYSDGAVGTTTRHTEMLGYSIKLALAGKDVETGEVPLFLMSSHSSVRGITIKN